MNEQIHTGPKTHFYTMSPRMNLNLTCWVVFQLGRHTFTQCVDSAHLWFHTLSNFLQFQKEQNTQQFVSAQREKSGCVQLELNSPADGLQNPSQKKYKLI